MRSAVPVNCMTATTSPILADTWRTSTHRGILADSAPWLNKAYRYGRDRVRCDAVQDMVLRGFLCETRKQYTDPGDSITRERYQVPGIAFGMTMSCERKGRENKREKVPIK
jgi:hypothetical protein